MNEPQPVEPQQEPAGGRSQAAGTGFGYALAQTRVRAGLSVEQAAGRLRLHPKQLRAIEAEDLEGLPAAAYVNGFVRNYARELGIDPAPLIEDLNAKLRLRGLIDNPPDLGSAGTGARVLDDQGWRHLVLAGIVAALVCAGVIGAWMARAGAPRAPRAAPPSPARMSDASAAPVPGPAPMATPATPPAAQGSAGFATSAAPGAATPGAGAQGTQASTAAGAPLIASAMPPAAERAPIVAATPAPAGGGGVPAATPGSGATASLVLRFNERSWVEVSRPDGRVLLSRTGEAGSMELLNASAPLLLVVGRAEAVDVEYRGQPVNLKAYANGNGVARLTLGDGRATSGGQSTR